MLASLAVAARLLVELERYQFRLAGRRCKPPARSF